jgi:hypothetical protein
MEERENDGGAMAGSEAQGGWTFLSTSRLNIILPDSPSAERNGPGDPFYVS